MNLRELLTIDGDTAHLRVKISPNAPLNEVYSVLSDDTVKIRIKAIPEKGKANRELISFLSKNLDISKEKISIVAGISDRVKIIKFNLRS